MISIKILGNEEECRQIEEITRTMLDFMGLAGRVDAAPSLTGGDGRHTAAFPLLLIDQKVVCSGRIPKAGEVSTWLADAALQE